MKRLVCLDGLRGLLAVYVMLSHTLPFAPMPDWAHWLFRHGGAGVDVFFVLSGLVIVQSLASFSYRPLPFLIARVARIYPVFLVVFGFAVAIQPMMTPIENLSWIGADSAARYIWSGGWPSDWAAGVVTHLTMTHGLFPNGVFPAAWVRFLGTSWSLSTEWQFYVLALLIGRRLGVERMAWLFVGMAAAALAWHVIAPEPWQFSRAFLPNKAEYFALGIASAMVVRKGRAGLGQYLRVLFAVLSICVLEGGPDKLFPPMLWTACLAAQLLPAVRSEGSPGGGLLRKMLAALAGVLQSKPMVWLGAVSYCIYLVHEPVQRLLGIALASQVHGNPGLFTAIWVPGSIVLPVLVSWWLHERVEVPALRLGRALATQRLALPAPRPQSLSRINVQ